MFFVVVVLVVALLLNLVARQGWPSRSLLPGLAAAAAASLLTWTAPELFGAALLAACVTLAAKR